MNTRTLLDTAVVFRDDVFRNICSLRKTRSLFADLVDDAEAEDVAIRAEMATKPRLPMPTVNRPFEDGYGMVVRFPFVPAHWSASRYSDGSFGVWYGSTAMDTTIYETAYHQRRLLIDSPKFDVEPKWPVVIERRVHVVALDALLFDVRGKVRAAPALVDPVSYTLTQSVGGAVARGNHPGLLVRSARCAGDNVAVMSPQYLSNVRDHCYLIYKMSQRETAVERTPGRRHLTIAR